MRNTVSKAIVAGVAAVAFAAATIGAAEPASAGGAAVWHGGGGGWHGGGWHGGGWGGGGWHGGGWRGGPRLARRRPQCWHPGYWNGGGWYNGWWGPAVAVGALTAGAIALGAANSGPLRLRRPVRPGPSALCAERRLDRQRPGQRLPVSGPYGQRKGLAAGPFF